MMHPLIAIITSDDAAIRDQALDTYCDGRSLSDLLDDCAVLEAFRQTQENLYERVRAAFFLYAIHRFHIPTRDDCPKTGHIPFDGYTCLLSRRFEEAIARFLAEQDAGGPSDAISSALASSYHRLAFQTLADQVRRSVRSVRGNQWMFRVSHPGDQPLRVREELMMPGEDGRFPILRESTPVRMDLTHSAWSDIFFLGMDAPDFAKVINVSIDLAVRGRDAAPKPPVEAYFRIIDEPLVRLSSVDLGATADITSLDEIFDFARDYLGLLKGALIASGLIPPGLEGSGSNLKEVLATLAGPGRGIELVSNVNGIPKGSRLAVSTNLLASLISVCMRATRQAQNLEGELAENERRLVAARAILGEWIAGSGGGWQDSGGVWPGIKLIEGQHAQDGDPEMGISRGRLLPNHHILDNDEASAATRQALQESLVLVHGGMAQNVGPILEMVTEKYLLRSPREWEGRQTALVLIDKILGDLGSGDIRELASDTTGNFFGPIQTIVPWASNLYTEELIRQAREAFGDDFWGFWMLGGMSGGGMGFIFAPERKAEAQERLQEIMSATRRRLQHALPFAMEPVVYDFAINEHGTFAQRLTGEDALMPAGYYAMVVPSLIRKERRELPDSRRSELDAFGAACRTRPELRGMVQTLFDNLLPRTRKEMASEDSLESLLAECGFDREQHEHIRAELRAGRIGLAQNRLPVSSDIRDVEQGDVLASDDIPEDIRERGLKALAAGEVAVISLAAGAGSRWTGGAGTVKALHPFAKLGGRHRTFVETHLAKSRRIGKTAGAYPAHIFTTSYLTQEPIAQALAQHNRYDYPGPLALSPGRSIGLRLVPMERDLRFAWEEVAQQVLDEQQQKMRESVHAALIGWARKAGEGSDYTDNVPGQCLHPVGHWYEVPNLLLNGTLAALLKERPQLKYLMVHNIDTLGADLDAGILGLHMSHTGAMTVEVTPRRLEDRGGGLARVDGRVRLVEGLAMPNEEGEFALTYYNSLTTWMTIDRVLALFGITRDDLQDQAKVAAGIRKLAARMPTYITLKDVKRRWGHGQEDVFPVAQFEKLWGDMTTLPEAGCRFVAVSRLRGQQLKDQAQLDGWLRDGSAAYVESLCEWE